MTDRTIYFFFDLLVNNTGKFNFLVYCSKYIGRVMNVKSFVAAKIIGSSMLLKFFSVSSDNASPGFYSLRCIEESC